MKVTGPIKQPKIAAVNIDNRIYLPKKWRDALDLTVDSPVELKIKAGKIIIRPLYGDEAEEAQKHVRKHIKK